MPVSHIPEPKKKKKRGSYADMELGLVLVNLG